MSLEATIATDEEDLANAYQTLSWIGNEISFWTEHQRFIRLQYEDETMTFLNTYHHKMEYETVIKDLTCKKQRIYIEWVQDTGKYLYYDLLATAKKVKKSTFNLSVFHYDIADNDCVQPSFDETAAPEKILTSDDIVILSPVRSFELQYTTMGQYYGDHVLYLGPFPSVQFMKQCHVQYLFNCCGYWNDADIRQLPNVKEIMFDVAGWIAGEIGDDDEDDKENEEEEKESTVKQYDQKYLEQLQLEYLDKQIDIVDGLLKKGNVLIHCLAGAHRSPFITGCYEYKYGTMNGKTPREIYKWLTGRREIVQPLGFDRWMVDYFAFLAEKGKNKK
eukprot:270760_1